MLLAGDIGGTKTVVALYSQESELPAIIKKSHFASQNYASLEEVIAKFLASEAITVARASFGIAGPVVEGVARTTNLPWVVDAQATSAQIQAPVRVLNDLAAIAHAIPFLPSSDKETLNAGKPAARGNLAVVAPGTGLGEAFLTSSGNRYHVHASEGGHASFSPANRLQAELLVFLQERFGHVSFERVCSGSGIPNLYSFLKETQKYPEPAWLAELLAQTDDPTPLIVKIGVESRAEISVATLDLFAEILANEAANMALKILATGGVYLAGGMPGRILSFLRKPQFLQSFMHKGRFSEMLKNMPVQVVINPESALFGAACHGFEPENFDD
jgi:glucokinase